MSAQPATLRGRETRERIVRAAAELVAEHGVAGTALDDVRARAHVSKSQLYHYFADRDDLMRAVAGAVSDEVVGGQTELFAQLDTIDGLRAWTDALVTLQDARQAKGGCPIGSIAGNPRSEKDWSGWRPAASCDPTPTPASSLNARLQLCKAVSCSPRSDAILTSSAQPSTVLWMRSSRLTPRINRPADDVI